jgi:2-polyprenyl-3-methyl-5-hydroxy-6-metoxy-1,4-benzoquinol methylase
MGIFYQKERESFEDKFSQLKQLKNEKIGWKDGLSAVRCIVTYGATERRRKGRKRRLQAPPHEQSRELHASLENLKGVDNYYDWNDDLIEPFIGDRVLEIGAGVGTVSARIGMGGRSVVAVEPDPRAFAELDMWAQGNSRHSAIAGTLSEATTSITSDFSSAVMVNVLEHIENEVAERIHICSVQIREDLLAIKTQVAHP